MPGLGYVLAILSSRLSCAKTNGRFRLHDCHVRRRTDRSSQLPAFGNFNGFFVGGYSVLPCFIGASSWLPFLAAGGHAVAINRRTATSGRHPMATDHYILGAHRLEVAMIHYAVAPNMRWRPVAMRWRVQVVLWGLTCHAMATAADGIESSVLNSFVQFDGTRVTGVAGLLNAGPGVRFGDSVFTTVM